MDYLTNTWYAAGFSKDFGRAPIVRTLLERALVFYRTEAGEPVALNDRCPHRFAPLHQGKLIGDAIRCPYHGLQFGPGGACVIGVKVATLPVIALGVGIGVDYALYILSVTLVELKAGRTLSVAYYKALLFTGRVVLLTGLTLAVGVLTWAFSDIKFHADMGLLLAFMFLWNMLGALVLIPALSHFLLRHRAPEIPSLAPISGEGIDSNKCLPEKFCAVTAFE